MTLALAGPGLPQTDSDLVLVPRHPETGELWQTPAVAIPLAYDAWLHFADRTDHRVLARTTVVPRDVPGPDLVLYGYLQPDHMLARSTLTRLPAAREGWLRETHDQYFHRLFPPTER